MRIWATIFGKQRDGFELVLKIALILLCLIACLSYFLQHIAPSESVIFAELKFCISAACFKDGKEKFGEECEPRREPKRKTIILTGIQYEKTGKEYLVKVS